MLISGTKFGCQCVTIAFGFTKKGLKLVDPKLLVKYNYTVGQRVSTAQFGKLLQSCFNESKEAYKEALKSVKIKGPGVQFSCKLHKLVLNYNQLQYCMVSLCFICNNFKAMEEICKSEPDNWK